MKKRVFQEVHLALTKAGKTLDGLFRKADLNQNNTVDVDELRNLFKSMKIQFTDSELQSIFRSIDFDFNDCISFPEFMTDFNKTVATETAVLLQQEKDRYETEMRRN